MLEPHWGIGVATTTHPANLMVTGEGKEDIALLGRPHG
jgi:hypothetical protein